MDHGRINEIASPLWTHTTPLHRGKRDSCTLLATTFIMTTSETSDSLNSETKIKSIAAGGGRITLAVHGTKAVFEDLSAAYPLKLLSPRINEPRVGVVYLLSYGGGLVAGDQVELDVVLKERSCLLVLSQVTI